MVYIMGPTDRKPWTSAETRSLIALREEMKAKFDAMKRNRSLWVELSDKLKNHFGHTRTPAQCAVRWKNILAAYKESRQGIKNAAPPTLPRICAFFKEVEAVVGDEPIPITALNPSGEAVRLDDSGVSHAVAAAAAHAAASASAGTSTVPPVSFASHTPTRRSRSGMDHAAVMHALSDLRAVVDAHGRALLRIEKLLTKEGGRRAADAVYDAELLAPGGGAVVEMQEAVAAEAAAHAAAAAAVVAATEAAAAQNVIHTVPSEQEVRQEGVQDTDQDVNLVAGQQEHAEEPVDAEQDVEEQGQEQDSGPAMKKARLDSSVDGRFATVS